METKTFNEQDWKLFREKFLLDKKITWKKSTRKYKNCWKILPKQHLKNFGK